MMPRPRHVRPVALLPVVVVVIGLVLVVLGLGTRAGSAGPPKDQGVLARSSSGAPAAASPVPSGGAVAVVSPVNPVPQPAAAANLTPVRVAIPSVHVDASVTPVGTMPDGSLELPATGHELGWWAAGARPGDAAGTVTVAGHVDTRTEGLGVFAALADVHPGAPITVSRADGTQVRYVVQALRTYPYDKLPDNLFTASGPATLALVTCTPPFDRAHSRYLRTLVVWAQ